MKIYKILKLKGTKYNHYKLRVHLLLTRGFVSVLIKIPTTPIKRGMPPALV